MGEISSFFFLLFSLLWQQCGSGVVGGGATLIKVLFFYWGDGSKSVTKAWFFFYTFCWWNGATSWLSSFSCPGYCFQMCLPEESLTSQNSLVCFLMAAINQTVLLIQSHSLVQNFNVCFLKLPMVRTLLINTFIPSKQSFDSVGINKWFCKNQQGGLSKKSMKLQNVQLSNWESYSSIWPGKSRCSILWFIPGSFCSLIQFLQLK